MDMPMRSIISVLAPVLAFVTGLIGGYRFLKEEISEETTNAVHLKTLQNEVQTMRGSQWEENQRIEQKFSDMRAHHDELEEALEELEKQLLFMKWQAERAGAQ